MSVTTLTTYGRYPRLLSGGLRRAGFPWLIEKGALKTVYSCEGTPLCTTLPKTLLYLRALLNYLFPILHDPCLSLCTDVSVLVQVCPFINRVRTGEVYGDPDELLGTWYCYHDDVIAMLLFTTPSLAYDDVECLSERDSEFRAMGRGLCGPRLSLVCPGKLDATF